MPVTQEPSFKHGRASLTGILLVNLGTPEAPTPPALRRYLAQFLSDRRVVEIPPLIWKLILHGIILRVRPRKSAAKYASVWMREGSPLRVWTEKQAKLLSGYLGERGTQAVVRYAMRYGQPSIAAQLNDMKQAGVTRVLVLPLYPQYSGATTASALDDLARWIQHTRHLPDIRVLSRFHDDPGYVQAVASRVLAHWRVDGRPDKLVISFHGMPRRTLDLGDPYHCECHKTARLLAQKLGLHDEEWVITFQSRFGRAEWLQPYTEPTLRKLAQDGVKRVDVVCPGFVADCIETLEEIAMEGRQAFLSSGGKDFHYIPCLNDQPEWIAALADLCQRHLQGWPTQAQDPAQLETQRQRALDLGAKQ